MMRSKMMKSCLFFGGGVRSGIFLEVTPLGGLNQGFPYYLPTPFSVSVGNSGGACPFSDPMVLKPASKAPF